VVERRGLTIPECPRDDPGQARALVGIWLTVAGGVDSRRLHLCFRRIEKACAAHRDRWTPAAATVQLAAIPGASTSVWEHCSQTVAPLIVIAGLRLPPPSNLQRFPTPQPLFGSTAPKPLRRPS
jgi:hypothetical protein